jgi:prephenate dehydrogenase
MRLAILGFGLIGGSVARALHERDPGGWSVAAWSPSGEAPRVAAGDGTIADVATTPEAAIDGADLVLLAAPPLACLELLDLLGGPLRARLARDAVISDVASTKRRLVARATELGLRFVGGHPMAGRETTGYGAAVPDLFVGRPWVLCGDDAAAERVERLATAVGARPLRMDAAEHDVAVAAISHLPLVLSAALVEAVASGQPAEAPDPRQLAAGGWASMTRLARGDPAMGAGILATNADEVARRLRVARGVIDEWIDALESDPIDTDRLRAKLAEARVRLDEPW